MRGHRPVGTLCLNDDAIWMVVAPNVMLVLHDGSQWTTQPGQAFVTGGTSYDTTWHLSWRFVEPEGDRT